MIDKWKPTKDRLVTFMTWLYETSMLPEMDPVAIDMVVEKFLSTQGMPANRLVPSCGHCGSESVVEGDFANEILVDSNILTFMRRENPSMTEGDLYAAARTVKSKSSGPAWVCQCGAYTSRES